MTRPYGKNRALILALALLFANALSLNSAFSQSESGAERSGDVGIAPGSSLSAGVSEVDMQADAGTEKLVWQFQKEPAGTIKVLKGSQFRVRLEQDLSSDSVQEGTAVSASLVDELRAGSDLIARAGQPVLGIVSMVSHSRRTIKSYLPGKNFLDAQGRIGFSFSGIVDSAGALLKIDAVPSEKTSVNQVKKTRAQLVANKNGEYLVKYAVGKYAAMDLAIGTVGLATGPVGILTSALVSGLAGSANKNFAAGRPVEDDEQFSKKKGFVMGVGRGLPGGALIQGVATSGKELELHKGDILTVSLREDLEVSAR
ncbi:MAG: hypothetical protein SFV17_16800 [Candidatus Obscuribacter sp.]|nr:hypothetical protein [Candidatus Obscuribacter sp.]